MTDTEFDSLTELADELGLDQANIPKVTRRSVKVGPDQQVSVLIWGEDQPELMFLHGGGQNAHTWDLVMTALGRPAIAIDLPGHGHSSLRDDRDYGPATNTPAIAPVISELAPAAAGVVGMWLGGLTLIRLAATRPELVRRAIIVDVTPGALVTYAGARFSGSSVIFSCAKFTGGTVYFCGASQVLSDITEFSGGAVGFVLAEFGGMVDFSFARFSGSDINFGDAQFAAGQVSFAYVNFCGSGVYFYQSQFSGGTVDFTGASLSGGTVDFSRVANWAHPPTFDTSTAPATGAAARSARCRFG